MSKHHKFIREGMHLNKHSITQVHMPEAMGALEAMGAFRLDQTESRTNKVDTSLRLTMHLLWREWVPMVI